MFIRKKSVNKNIVLEFDDFENHYIMRYGYSIIDV